MNEQLHSLARAVVWAGTSEEVSRAQAALWMLVAPDIELFHTAIWQAGLERADYLRWLGEQVAWRHVSLPAPVSAPAALAHSSQMGS